MGARRALLETEQVELRDPALASFQQRPRRGIIEDVETDALFSVSAYSPARRAVASPISFEPDEPLTSTRRLPKITDAPVKKLPQSSLKFKRGLLSAAAALTAGAVLIVPNAISIGNAQPNQAAADRIGGVSRNGERPSLADPITQADAEARAAEAERKAEEERIAAEQRAAEEAAAAQAAAEAERKAEEERIAAEQQAAEEAAAAATQPVANGSAPAAAQPAPAPAASAPLPTGNCAYGDGSNLGLTYQAQAAFQAICAQFPGVTSYGGWRGTADDHGAGQAIDP